MKKAVDDAVGAYAKYEINAVKSSDKDTINQTGATVNGVLSTYDKNLTANQKATLNNALTKATSLIARIDEVAGIINEFSTMENLSDDILKITDKDKIELVLGYQTGITNNLTEENKTVVNKKQEQVTELVDRIEVIEEVIK